MRGCSSSRWPWRFYGKHHRQLWFLGCVVRGRFLAWPDDQTRRAGSGCAPFYCMLDVIVLLVLRLPLGGRRAKKTPESTLCDFENCLASKFNIDPQKGWFGTLFGKKQEKKNKKKKKAADNHRFGAARWGLSLRSEPHTTEFGSSNGFLEKQIAQRGPAVFFLHGSHDNL